MGETWETHAACRDHKDIFHSPYIDYQPSDHTFLGLPGTPRQAIAIRDEVRAEAKKVCSTCPSIVDCGIWALQNQFYGVAAGMTPDVAQDYREMHTIKVNEITAAQMAEFAGVAERHGGKHVIQASQVLPLVDQGWTNAQIAEHFSVSVRTVIRVRVDARAATSDADLDAIVVEAEEAGDDMVEYATDDQIEALAEQIARDALITEPGSVFISVPMFETMETDEDETPEDVATVTTVTVSAPVTPAPRATMSPYPVPRADSRPMLPGKRVQAGRLSPAMRIAWNILGDGAWHHIEELVGQAVDNLGLTGPDAKETDVSMRNAASASARLRHTMQREGDWYRATSGALKSLAPVPA